MNEVYHNLRSEGIQFPNPQKPKKEYTQVRIQATWSPRVLNQLIQATPQSELDKQKEEEELQLALALSLSESENQRSTYRVSLCKHVASKQRKS